MPLSGKDWTQLPTGVIVKCEVVNTTNLQINPKYKIIGCKIY